MALDGLKCPNILSNFFVSDGSINFVQNWKKGMKKVLAVEKYIKSVYHIIQVASEQHNVSKNSSIA